MIKKERMKMPVSERAKQFMPFAAVTGLNAALREKERELGLVEKAELSEEVIEEINRKLAALKAGDEVTVTWYQDGEYIVQKGIVKRMNADSLLFDDVNVEYENIQEVEINE